MLSYPELRTSPRLDLNQAIPLPRPLTIYLEPTNVCNFKCVMCPESSATYGTEAGYYQHMDAMTWQKVFSELKRWGKIKSLKFYFEGEPLLNRALPSMIQQAHDWDLAERLELTTNLSMLDHAYAFKLIGSGLHYVRISVYGVDDRHQLTTGSKWTPKEIFDRARMFRGLRDSMKSETPRLHAQYFPATLQDDVKFRQLWEPVVDTLGSEPLHNWGGSLTQISGEPVNEPCAAPFYMMAIHANGDVSACCVDWQSKLKIGSVKTQTLQEIWTGPKMREIQRQHLAGRRCDLAACANCTARFPDRLTTFAAGFQKYSGATSTRC